MPVREAVLKAAGGRAMRIIRRTYWICRRLSLSPKTGRPAGITPMATERHCMSTKTCFIATASRTALTIWQRANYRLIKKIKLQANKLYRASCYLKTENVSNPQSIRMVVLGQGDRRLSPSSPEVKKTQDWTKHTIVFNSQEFSEANFYVGGWGTGAGTFWIDEIEIRECLGVNWSGARGVRSG